LFVQDEHSRDRLAALCDEIKCNYLIGRAETEHVLHEQNVIQPSELNHRGQRKIEQVTRLPNSIEQAGRNQSKNKK
jgi:hypothetical protein